MACVTFNWSAAICLQFAFYCVAVCAYYLGVFAGIGAEWDETAYSGEEPEANAPQPGL